MQRTILLDSLNKASPALAVRSLIPALTHFWFTGKVVIAYNDIIGIEVPIESEFEGAVSGATLMSILSTTGAKRVDLREEGDNVLVRVGKTRLRLPIISLESVLQLFEMPEEAHEKRIHISGGGVISAIENCLRSVSQDTSVPDQLGITVIPQDDKLNFYSTNGVTISHVSVRLSKATSLRSRVVLSGMFCDQVVKLSKQDKKAKLLIGDDYSLLSLSDGTRVFGKLIVADKPLDFATTIEQATPRNARKNALDVPKLMRTSLKRARIISESTASLERGSTKILVKDGLATLITKSNKGELRDRVTLGEHLDVSLTIDPHWLSVGCDDFDKILFGERCALMFGKGSDDVYMVSYMYN